MGVELGPDDVAFRLNFVWLEAHFGKLYMGDFSAGHISTSEGAELIATLQKELGGEEFMFTRSLLPPFAGLEKWER